MYRNSINCDISLLSTIRPPADLGRMWERAKTNFLSYSYFFTRKKKTESSEGITGKQKLLCELRKKMCSPVRIGWTRSNANKMSSINQGLQNTRHVVFYTSHAQHMLKIQVVQGFNLCELRCY